MGNTNRILVVSANEMNSQVQVMENALNEMEESFTNAVMCLTQACDGSSWKGHSQKAYEEKLKELNQEGLASLNKLKEYMNTLCTSIQGYEYAEAQNKSVLQSLEASIIN